MNKEKNIGVPKVPYPLQNGKPQRFTSYFSDMTTWIRKDVCEAVDSGLLNVQMTGPRHCEVLKCEERKIEDTSGGYIKRITDNQTSIIAVFLKEAVDKMLQKRLEEPDDSQINWEEGVVILEKYRIIYLTLPESKNGTFAIQVDKFDYLGEPLSSLMKDYPFVIQRSEDDPELQKKCEDFEQKFAVKQTNLDILRLKQALAPDSLESSTELDSLLNDVLEEVDPLAKTSVKESVKSLCAGNNAADFLLISSQSSQLLDKLESSAEHKISDNGVIENNSSNLDSSSRFKKERHRSNTSDQISSKNILDPGADTVSKACNMNFEMSLTQKTPAALNINSEKEFKVLRSGRLIHRVNKKQTSDTKYFINEQKTSSLNDSSLLLSSSLLSEDYNTRSRHKITDKKRTLKNYENEQNATEKSVLASRSPSKRKSVGFDDSGALKNKKYLRKESSVTNNVNMKEKSNSDSTLPKDCDNLTCSASTDKPNSLIHSDFISPEDTNNRVVDKNVFEEFCSNSDYGLFEEKCTINESNPYCEETRIVNAVSQDSQPSEYTQSESNAQEEELGWCQKTIVLSSEEYNTTPDLNIQEIAEGSFSFLSQIPSSHTTDCLKNHVQVTIANNTFSGSKESLDESLMISPTPVKENRKKLSENNFKSSECSRLEAQKEIRSCCTTPHDVIDLTHSSSSEENETYVLESKTALSQEKINTEYLSYADNDVESQVDSSIFDGCGMTYTFMDSPPGIVEKPSNNYSDHLNQVIPLTFDKDACRRNLNFQPKAVLENHFSIVPDQKQKSACHDVLNAEMKGKRFEPWCNACERSLISCTCSFIRMNLNTLTDSEIFPIHSKSKCEPEPYLTPNKEKPKSESDDTKIKGMHESGLDVTAYERKHESRHDVIVNKGKQELEFDVAANEGKQELELDVAANEGKQELELDVVANEGKQELELDVAANEGKQDLELDVAANEGTSYSLQIEEGRFPKFPGISTSAEVTLPETTAALTSHHHRHSNTSVFPTGYVSFDFTDSQIERMMHLLLRMLDIKPDI